MKATVEKYTAPYEATVKAYFEYLHANPELSFEGTAEVVEKLVPAKKAALKELNMKALNMGKTYNK